MTPSQLRPLYDRTSATSAVAVVNYDLALLNLAQQVKNGQRIVPVGLGWCRAIPAPEEAWPLGAELCVLVQWFPDEEFLKVGWKAPAPQGAEAHWGERIAATLAALRTLGYVAEQWGPPQTPHLHMSAELVVYRMPPGVPAPPHPAYLPVPQEHEWYRDSPQGRVRRDLDQSFIVTRPRDTERGSFITIRVDRVLWPQKAVTCALVAWLPDDQMRIDPDSPDSSNVPQDVMDYWESEMARITGDLRRLGYQVRRRERPWNPAVDKSADLLVYSEEPWTMRP